MVRTCPYCGVAVQSTSKSCPRCFKKLDTEAEFDYSYTEEVNDPVSDMRKDIEKHVKKTKLEMALAIIPAFIGLIGLGAIYHDWKDKMGYLYLLIGAAFFYPSAILILGHWTEGILMGFLKILLYVILTILYLSTAASSASYTLGWGRNKLFF